MSNLNPPGVGRTSADLFGTFIDIEGEARKARSEEALLFVMANQPRRLFDCDQIVVASIKNGGSVKLMAASNVMKMERSSPLVHWMETNLGRIGELDVPRLINKAEMPLSEVAAWDEWWPEVILWIPVQSPDGLLLGGLWISRAGPWKDAEIVLLKKLAECFGHAWAHMGRGVTQRRWLRRRSTFGHPLTRALLVSFVIAGVLAVPVRQSVVAPAEVVSANPHVIAAPLDGVIKLIHVRPNQPIKKGEALFSFEDTALRAAADQAQQSLNVAKAELERALQAGFSDITSNADVDVLTKRVKLSQATLNFHRENLSQVIVRASHDGIALFSSQQDWTGRPVQIGQKVMTVANLGDAALRIELPMSDVIQTPERAEVSMFLAIDPLSPVPARVDRISYQARETGAKKMAFLVDASFETGKVPRVGLRGTAKLYGYRVPLGLYLFRRPIVALRQMIGF